MEDVHGVKYRERTGTFLLSESAALPKPPRVHRPHRPSNPAILGFYEGFISQAWLIKSLAIGDFSTSSPSLLPGGGSGGGSGTEPSTL